jgi:hypothetical protein
MSHPVRTAALPCRFKYNRAEASSPVQRVHKLIAATIFFSKWKLSIATNISSVPIPTMCKLTTFPIRASKRQEVTERAIPIKK